MFQPSFNFNELIKITSNGLHVASFVQIKEALIKRYKEIYGTDINLSETNADGVFVNELALVINNILQTVQNIYSNLDVEIAYGDELEKLCRLSNITRKEATNSIAKVLITNIGSSTYEGVVECFDSTGRSWSSKKSYSIPGNSSVMMNISCSEAGKISAAKGWINQTLLSTLTVEQLEDAIEGSNRETDAELRDRRNQSTSAQGSTTLESMLGALLSLAGIKDAKIYNNSSSTSLTQENSITKDKTPMSANSVYVVLKYDESVETSNEDISDVIYSKLTPGIKTNQFIGAQYIHSGESKENSFYPTIGVREQEIFSQTVYWKKAKPIAPAITITIKTYEYFSQNEIMENIFPAVKEYCNSLALGHDIDIYQLQYEILEADPKFKNASTYSLLSVSPLQTLNPDTYFNYTSCTFSKSGNNYTITIS